MNYKVEESYSITRSKNRGIKYSKSKSLTLNCEAKNIFNRLVSLGSTSVDLEPPIVSLRF